MRKSKSTDPGTRYRDEQTHDEVKATHLIRQMRGKSRSILALGSDDEFYIIKFAGNPKGRSALANEILGYQIAQALGVRVPKVFLATVPNQLIRYAPKDWFDGYISPSGPDAGWHFATRYAGSPHEAVTWDILPRRVIPRIENRDDFLMMLVFDIWANNKQARQVVFERAGMRWLANFIDFGSV